MLYGLPELAGLAKLVGWLRFCTRAFNGQTLSRDSYLSGAAAGQRTDGRTGGRTGGRDGREGGQRADLAGWMVVQLMAGMVGLANLIILDGQLG